MIIRSNPALRPSFLWNIRHEIPRWLQLFLPFLALILLLLLWITLSSSQLVSSTYLPAPIVVLQAGWQMLTQDQLIGNIVASSLRVLIGFLLAALVSIPVGILMGAFRSMDCFLGAIVRPMRYLPVNALIPLVIIWFGLGESGRIFIIFLSIVFYNSVMIADAVWLLPEEMLNAAYTLGANRIDVLFQVILPATLPNILNALRVNIAAAWNVLVVAELIAANSGLGYAIVKAQRFLQTDRVLVGIILIGVIGLLLDYVFRLLNPVLVPWAEEPR